MKKLTKAQLATRDQCCIDLINARDDLKAAVSTYNNVKEREWDALQAAISVYNDEMSDQRESLRAAEEAYDQAVAEARELKNEIAFDIRAYMENKTDKWNEGPMGDRYRAWLEEWEERIPDVQIPEHEDVESMEPSDITLDIEDEDEKLENISEELPE